MPRSHLELIGHLRSSGVLHTPALVEVFRTVDRKHFVPVGNPYADAPVSIGEGQTISQPTTVAIMLELLQPEKGQKVLDVGAGSGWTTALLLALGCEVVAVELLADLVEFGNDNLERAGFVPCIQQAAEGVLGAPDELLFDRILVSAAAEELPDPLVWQLADEGVMVIPVKSSVWWIQKHHEHLHRREYPGFAFVPLR